MLVINDLLLFLRVIEVVNTVNASDEVGVICIYVAVLNSDQVFDHLVCRLQTIHQQAHHFVVDSLPQSLESEQFRHFNLENDSPQFLENQLNTLEAWRLKSLDLLLR